MVEIDNKFKLLPPQQQDLDLLINLFDINKGRGTGRSYTLAVALITLAMKYPGHYIHVIDHSEPILGPRDIIKISMIQNIRSLITMALGNEEVKKFTFSRDKFKYEQ